MPKTESLDEFMSRNAAEFADHVRNAAELADTEEDLRIEVETQLRFIKKKAGIEFENAQGKGEYTVAKGRINSLHTRVLIEYKNPADEGARLGARLDSPGSKQVVEQIKSRFRGLKDEHGRALKSLFGVGLDGNHFIFVRFRGGKWDVQEPVKVSKHSAERFHWVLYNLGQKGKPFSPENLARDFGAMEGSMAVEGVRALYEAIAATDHPQALTFFRQWKILFGEVCGYDLDKPSTKVKKLAEFYGLPSTGLKPAELLFALHTYYALFMKLLASEIVAFFHNVPTPLKEMHLAPSGAKLRCEMEQLEAGSVFRRLNITNFLEGDLFAWYTAVWNDPIEALVRRMVSKLDEYNPGTMSEDPITSRDLLKKLYQQLFPKSVRHDLGEYYTPDWLAEHVLNEVGYSGDPDKRLLDPACGSGTFLVMAINRIKAWFEENREKCPFDEGDLCKKILANVAGFDLNPLAVMAARTNYLIAIRDLLRHVNQVELPVYLCDSIIAPSKRTRIKNALAPLLVGKVDYVVGNPPWVVWDNLPADYRDSTKEVWERYGLFTLSAAAARHGGGKKDISMLMLYASADAYLKSKGKLGFVITQTVFQTKGAGEGFRRFRLGKDGEWLGVTRVDDMVDFQPFEGASNWTSTLVLQKGKKTQWPVPYFRWSLIADLPEGNPPGWERAFARSKWEARPIDEAKSNSPWMISPKSVSSQLIQIIAPAQYTAHLGANSGGANGIYWIRIVRPAANGVLIENVAEKSKAGIEKVNANLEPDLLYPLLRWSDISRYHALPSCYLILAQDVSTRRGYAEPSMGRKWPKTYAYLKRFENSLLKRAAYRRYQSKAPFYSMYDIGEYTLAPIKVVWRRMDRQINAAVVAEIEDEFLGRRPVVPQETCVLIEAGSLDEAHYLCAVLNSALANFLVQSHSVRGGKGFGAPSMLNYVPLARFKPRDKTHRILCELSLQAHQQSLRGMNIEDIQESMDETVAALWGVEKADLAAVKQLSAPTRK